MTGPMAKPDGNPRGAAWIGGGAGAGLLLCAGLAVCVLAYLPGLTGGFLLDDFLHLPALGAYGGVVDLPRLLLYLTSSGGDTLGRPLTLLSFLLDDNGWPSEAYAFKRTSLLLHLINGLLLTLVLLRLGVRVALESVTARRAAVLAALLWLLHPLFVSTTLYVIQRATILVTAFCLLAMLAWDASWQAQVEGKARRAWLLAIAALLASLGGALCKANGILTPILLAGTVCLVYLPSQPAAAIRHSALAVRIRRWTIALPAAASVAAVLLYSAWSVWHGSDANGWSWSGRILSQPRALMDYLGLLILPREGSRGVFADGFLLSSGLWDPVTTIPAVLSLVGLVFATWFWRRRPLVSLPLGFFLVGHVLESGVINLEPYFEHRNYLPAILLPWPLAVALLSPRARARGPRLLIAVLLPCALAAITYLRSSTWSDERQMALLASARYPGSQRAELLLSSVEIGSGRAVAAVERLDRALDLLPDKPLLAFNLIHASCVAGLPPAAALAHARQALATATAWDRSVYGWLSQRIERPELVPCPGFSRDETAQLLSALADNPNLADDASAQQDIVALSAELTLAAGHRPEGVDLMDRALALDPSPESCAWLAARLLRLAGLPTSESFVQGHAACDLSRRRRGQGLGRLHTMVLEHYPEHDALRHALNLSPRLQSMPLPAEEVLKPQAVPRP